MGGFVMAWMVGEGIIIYRSVKENKAPPGPGQLLLSSGVFVLLALLAESKEARTLATTLAWGFDIAAFMNIKNIGGRKSKNPGKWPPGPIGSNTIIPSGNSAFDSEPGSNLGSGTFSPHTKGA
jgi:hypothetical protein